MVDVVSTTATTLLLQETLLRSTPLSLRTPCSHSVCPPWQKVSGSVSACYGPAGFTPPSSEKRVYVAHLCIYIYSHIVI